MNAEIRDITSKNDIMVTVFLITYNHAPYIRQTMDAILNQKINFKMQLLVHDDASTDGTGEIIREYADRFPDIITMIIQRENKYQKNIAVDLEAIPYIYGKYVALCEGDDYWPTDDKLRKQVDYMERHSNIAGTGGLTRFYDDNDVECMESMPDSRFLNRVIEKNEYIYGKGFNVATNTLMFWPEIIKDANYIQARKISPKVADSLIVTNMFNYGSVYMFEDCFQNHRIQMRAESSNYNSLFDTKEKFEDRIRLLNAQVTCLKTQNMKRWYIITAGMYFWVFLKEHNVKSFFEVAKKVTDGYRKYTILAVLYTFFVFVPKLIFNHLKRVTIIFNRKD